MVSSFVLKIQSCRVCSVPSATTSSSSILLVGKWKKRTSCGVDGLVRLNVDMYVGASNER